MNMCGIHSNSKILQGNDGTPDYESLDQVPVKDLDRLCGEDDVLPLDQWGFNTEAHPFRVQPG